MLFASPPLTGSRRLPRLVIQANTNSREGMKMTTKKLSSLAVAIAAFAMACADPATAPSGVQMLSGVTRAIIEDNDGTPPLPVLAGRVQVCKLANATGTFGFSWSMTRRCRSRT